MPHKKTRFRVKDVYKRRHHHALHFARERYSFWVATLSLFTFVVGNMVGQHGWYAFWHSVFGKVDDSMIVFTGTVAPIDLVPDYVKWSQYGGDIREHTYRQVPRDVLVPLPPYDQSEQKHDYEHSEPGDVYSVGHMGSYETGAEGDGSHVGVDIRVPVGTPVRSIANGIVEQVKTVPNGFGNYIVIRHPNVPDTSDAKKKKVTTVYSTYAHLDTMMVEEGMIVEKGGLIGTSGKTGFATGPHLHFQIDRADAPWHPYWPFSTGDANDAQLTFVGAINKGLKQDNGYLYTLHPMDFVQRNMTYVIPVAAQTPAVTDGLSSSSQPVLTQAQRVEARKAERLARANVGGGNDEVIGGVVGDSGASSSQSSSISVVADLSSSSSSSAASIVTIPAAPAVSPVTSIEIDHDGAYRRSWETVRIIAKDAQGNTVRSPVFPGKIYLRAGFGDAEIRPMALTEKDFKDGEATVHVLPFTRKRAMVLETYGAYTVIAKPMEYEE